MLPLALELGSATHAYLIIAFASTMIRLADSCSYSAGRLRQPGGGLGSCDLSAEGGGGVGGVVHYSVREEAEYLELGELLPKLPGPAGYPSSPPCPSSQDLPVPAALPSQHGRRT